MSRIFFVWGMAILLMTISPTVGSAQELAEASGDGNLARVRELLAQNVDPNQPDSFGFTPLMKASKSGHFIIVKELIKNGADVNKKNEIYTISNTPLHVASEGGHVEIVKELLLQGADVNQMDSFDKTPLALAEEEKQEEVVKILQRGASAVMGDALLKASQDNNPARVKELLERGASPDLQDENGLTPLHYATTNEQLDMVQLLLGHDANPDMQDNDGYTPLHWAAYSGFLDIVKELVRYGADPDVKNDESKTATDLASEEGYTDIEELLLTYGATSALFQAIEDGDADAVQKILAQDNVDLEQTDEDGRTFLHWATIDNHPKIVKMLLDTNKIDPNEVDEEGMTPLHWACEKDYLDVVRELLARPQTDPNVQDNQGFVALNYALGHSTLDVLNVLLADDRIDPNVSDEKGLTPLHYAVIRDNLAHDRLDIIKALLSNTQTNVNVQDKILGNTPLHYATARGFSDIVQVLLGKGAKPDVENKINQMVDESTRNQDIKKLFAPQEQEPEQVLKDCTITRTPGTHNLVVKIAGLTIRRDINAKASGWALEDNGIIQDATDASSWEIKVENNDTFVKIKNNFLLKAKLEQTLAKRLNLACQIFELLPILYDVAYPQSTELVRGTLPILPTASQSDLEYVLTKNRFTKHFGVKRNLGHNAWFVVFRPMEDAGVPGSDGYVYDSVNQRFYTMSTGLDGNVILHLNDKAVKKENVADAVKNINIESAFQIFKDYSAITTLRSSSAICNLCMKIVQNTLAGQTFSSSTIAQTVDNLVSILEKLIVRWSGQNIDQQEVSAYVSHLAEHLRDKNVQALLVDMDQYKDKAWVEKIMTKDIGQVKLEYDAWKGKLGQAEDTFNKKDAEQLKQSAIRANLEKMRQKIQAKNATNPSVSSLHDFENKLGKLRDSLAKLHNSLAALRTKIGLLKNRLT